MNAFQTSLNVYQQAKHAGIQSVFASIDEPTARRLVSLRDMAIENNIDSLAVVADEESTRWLSVPAFHTPPADIGSLSLEVWATQIVVLSVFPSIFFKCETPRGSAASGEIPIDDLKAHFKI